MQQLDSLAPLLTPEQVAGILGVRQQTLSKWRCFGLPPRYVKVARSTVRYDPADVQEFIERRKRASTAAAQP